MHFDIANFVETRCVHYFADTLSSLPPVFVPVVLGESQYGVEFVFRRNSHPFWPRKRQPTLTTELRKRTSYHGSYRSFLVAQCPSPLTGTSSTICRYMVRRSPSLPETSRLSGHSLYHSMHPASSEASRRLLETVKRGEAESSALPPSQQFRGWLKHLNLAYCWAELQIFRRKPLPEEESQFRIVL